MKKENNSLKTWLHCSNSALTEKKEKKMPLSDTWLCIEVL